MKAAVNQPTSEITLYAGIFMKIWTIPDADSLVPQHAHAHPHISLLVSGAVRVFRGGVQIGEHHAPAAIKIPAKTLHAFLTLGPDTVIACVHASDTADVPIVAEHNLVLED